jgi:hypothetical protein
VPDTSGDGEWIETNHGPYKAVAGGYVWRTKHWILRMVDTDAPVDKKEKVKDRQL